MVRVRNFLVDELSGAHLQLQAVHLLHAQVFCRREFHGVHVTSALQAKVRIAELHAGVDLVLSGEMQPSRICICQAVMRCTGADTKAVFKICRGSN